MKFSVLLLYPDYIAENFGQDTTFQWTEADSVAEAIENARQQTVVHFDTGFDSDDLFPLLVIEGYHQDLTP